LITQAKLILNFNLYQFTSFVQLAQGTPMAAWAIRLNEWKSGPFYYAHLADALRLLTLYRYGGVYFDTDVIFFKSMVGLENVVGLEDAASDKGVAMRDKICNAVMKVNFPRNTINVHSFLFMCACSIIV
jgi:hypothetical protein